MKISVRSPNEPPLQDRQAPAPTHQVIASDLTTSPLGQVTLLVSILNCRGVEPAYPLRVFKDYAWVIVTRGEGHYRDGLGRELPVRPGDAILVLPGFAHTYAPEPGTRWDEVSIVFNGPVFDLWRELGLLSSSNPVTTLPTGRDWVDGLCALYRDDVGQTEAARCRLRVCGLIRLLTEALAGTEVAPDPQPAHWLSRACSLLGDIDRVALPVPEIAESLGMSVETFRRKFQKETGLSPAHWRAERTMEMACHWMQYTRMTNAQIATRLGFSDEFHFSRRFRQLRGQSPSEFRKHLRT
jgi:AraC-like DNA-binding protein